MVTISNFKQRKNAAGEVFNALILQGDVELVRSQQTGEMYATARQCSITSTFSDAVCKTLLGKKLPGRIIKVEVAPYDYAIPETGEVIQLEHSYRYEPEEEPEEQEESVEEEVFAYS